jgi:hypothetical protein
MAFLAPIAGAIGSGLSSVLSIGSTILGVMGTLAQAQAQSNAAEYNAKVNKINAQTSTEQAATVAAQKNRETRQRIAQGTGAVMQNGFEVSGSPLDVLNQAQDQGNLDYLTAVYSGQVKAAGYKNQAEMDMAESKNALAAGAIGAASQLFSGMSNIYKNRGSVQMSL